ncbi:MAG TPA: hypothetical protein VM098_02485, partial [Phycisphaerae bacterium]|nr:hypothetical protein [Phycisphaerae bacterium]
GGVLGALASTVITHFINWTYQAVGPQGAPGVAEMVRQSILRGVRLVERELARRGGREAPGDDETAGRYRSLGCYSEEQLQAGLRIYQRSLDSGAWEIGCKDGQLWFASQKGRWLERNGNAFWKAR